MRTTRTTRSTPDTLPDGSARPGLLVSVRDLAEAIAALEGGAQIIDVKEPSRGPLGAPDKETVEVIVQAVAGRAPVTAACGELTEHLCPPAPVEGVAAYKIGLADAPSDWGDLLTAWREGLPASTHVVPAAYWDHESAYSPRPEAVLPVAASLDGWMVLDTWDKSSGPLPVDDDRLAHLMRCAHDAGVKVALAGGLTLKTLPEAIRLDSAVLGVRGAACVGGREGPLESTRVRALQEKIARTKRLGLP